MKFKVGDKVRTLNPHSWTYKYIGVITTVGLLYGKHFYRVRFNDVGSAVFYNDDLEPYYNTHDILEEIICS